jgi:hypothetical protein
MILLLDAYSLYGLADNIAGTRKYIPPMQYFMTQLQRCLWHWPETSRCYLVWDGLPSLRAARYEGWNRERVFYEFAKSNYGGTNTSPYISKEFRREAIDIAEKLGIPSILLPGLECPDVCYGASRLFGGEVIIVTVDPIHIQCIDKQVFIFDCYRDKLVDAANIKQSRGYYPQDYPFMDAVRSFRHPLLRATPRTVLWALRSATKHKKKADRERGVLDFFGRWANNKERKEGEVAELVDSCSRYLNSYSRKVSVHTLSWPSSLQDRFASTFDCSPTLDFSGYQDMIKKHNVPATWEHSIPFASINSKWRQVISPEQDTDFGLLKRLAEIAHVRS